MKFSLNDVNSMETLHIYIKDGKEFQFPLIAEKISVGRLSDNNIHFKDAFCSGHHAFLYAVDNGYAIREDKSKNGTLLNGKRIPGRAELKKSDEILIGTTRIVYEKADSSKYQ